MTPEGQPPLPKLAYVVDDDDAFRASVVLLLESSGWIVEGFESLEKFSRRAAELEPGLVLLDLHLGSASGLDLIESDEPALEAFAIVMVTGAGEVASAVRAMKAGAADFVEKTSAPDELLDRLDRIHASFTVEFEQRSARLDARKRITRLSGRERDVLERLLSGASNKMIARDLRLSPRTVEMHRARMLAKLGVATTAEALDIGRRADVKPVTRGGD